MEDIKRIKEVIIELGKQVAVENTTTQFPEWCLLKIGIHKIQGLPFDQEYYEGLLEPNTCSEQNN